MMTLPKLFTLLTAVQIASCSYDYSSIVIADRCQDAPDFDWDTSVNEYLRNITDSITIRGPDISLIPGIKFGPLKVTGLGHLWSYKPHTSFCAGNTTYIEAHVFADKPLRFHFDWKTCSGQRGEAGIRVSSNSLRLIFVGREDYDMGVWLFKIFPESLEDAALYVDGGSEWLRRPVLIANVIIRPQLELFWSTFLRRDARYYMRQNVETSTLQNPQHFGWMN